MQEILTASHGLVDGTDGSMDTISFTMPTSDLDALLEAESSLASEMLATMAKDLSTKAQATSASDATSSVGEPKATSAEKSSASTVEMYWRVWLASCAAILLAVIW